MSTEHNDEITEVNEDLELNSEDAENVAGGVFFNSASGAKSEGDGDSLIFF